MGYQVILTSAILFGLFAAGLAMVVRAVVPTLWLLKKPLSCDLCMSWWGSLVSWVLGTCNERCQTGGWIQAPLFIGAAVAVSVLTLKAANRLTDV